MSLVSLDGRREFSVPPRRKVFRMPDAETHRTRDRLVIQELLKGDRTRDQVAETFGISRRTVYRIEERFFSRAHKPVLTRRWLRPDNRRRAERAAS